MAKGQLILLIGQIASGKSTLAREYAKQGAIIVNDDAIVAALHAGSDTLYRVENKPIYKAVENTIVQAALALGRTVVIDRPCATRATRARYISLAKSLDCPVCAVWLGTQGAKFHAKRRYESDNRGHSLEAWQKVAERIEASLEFPEMHAEGLASISFPRPIVGSRHETPAA